MLRSLLLILILTSLACAGKKIKRADAELAALHFKIGTGYLTSGSYPQALQEFLIAERLNPKSPTILNNIGLVYYVRERHDIAIKKIKKAILINPSFSEARNNLARIYIEKGEIAKAIKQLNLVNKDLVYPHPEKSWTNLGLAYLKQKEYEASKSALQKAISLNRKYCPAFILFGRVFFEEKKYQMASLNLDKASAICSEQNYSEPNYYGALSYLKLGKKALARARMEELIAKFPNGKYAEKAKTMLKLTR